MKIDILNGDCLDMMATLPDESVDMCVTSPPYWGLRDYGGEGRVWGAPECYERGEGDTSHEWEGYTRPSENTRKNNNSLQLKSAYWEPQEQAFCKHCDAWFGQLGLEPTPEQYVKNMVEIFREVKRVLKPEGTLWLNLGDSYCAGSRKTSTPQSMHDGEERNLPQNQRNQASGDLKGKDLVGIPWMVAFALRADGWYLRQDIIWAKPNCMPESVKDRCTKNHEYIFLLSKSKDYFYDNEAIKEDTVTKADKNKSAFAYADNEDWAKDKDASRISKAKGISEARTKNYAKRNKRSVWWVGPKPFPEAHFAVFPIELIEPCILAGSPVGGTVLDPFGGSGTTGIVAIKHGRNAILTELSEKYVEIAEARIASFRAEAGMDKEGVEWL
jgi:DNA modification methylase